MWSHLKEQGIVLPKIKAKEIDKKVDPVLRQMEKEGIKLDVSVLKKMAKKNEARIADLEKEIHKIAKSDFNIDSPMQMAEVLFKKLKLPTDDLKKTKTGYSTGAAELRKLEKKHKIIKPILEYRELSKLLSTYLLPLPKLVDKNSRLHTTYGQDTNTGRINSSNPNLQNIPIRGESGSEIRKAFIAEKDHLLISADYSQIELRVVACLANDEVMIESFRNNEDIHRSTAAEIFSVDQNQVTSDQRRKAKTVNFGILYGMSPYGLSQALSIDQKEAGLYIERYFSIHKGIKEYCNKMIGLAKTKGYVETLFGLRRDLPNINAVNRTLADADERIAINTPIQGTAAEILKLAMIKLASSIQNTEYGETKMLLTIHDEILLEVPKEEAKDIVKLVKETMEKIIKLSVPIEAEVSYGKNWGQAKE